MAGKTKTNTEINGYNYYRTILTLGKDTKGKPIKKQFYGTSMQEALNKKKQYVKALDTGLNPDLSTQSLAQAMYTWLWDVEKYSGNKSSSFERYEGIYRNYVKDTDLSILTIANIKRLSIQKYYNRLKSSNKSSSQIKNLNKLLNKFFGYAEIEGYIFKNPCTGISIPKDSEENLEDEFIIETFTQDEVKRIVKSLGNEKIRYIIMFALFTGVREGEILALNKSDIKGNIVKINKTLRSIKVYDSNDKHHYETKTTKPKSKTSNREVPIPDILSIELEKLSALVLDEKLKLGSAYIENNLLFPTLTGKYMDAKNLRRSWKRVLNQADVSYKKFHALRHTYATRLFENNTSIVTVSKLLGHSSTRTTEIYTHVLEDIKLRDVQCLNNMLL